jgi:type III restriction enzyme
VFKELPLVNRIRPRVKAWREAGYPGVTGTTRRLLEHWRDPELFEERRFFCQLEAIETLIWLTEGPAGERQGLEVPDDGGPFPRLCAKMAHPDDPPGATAGAALPDRGCRFPGCRVRFCQGHHIRH